MIEDIVILWQAGGAAQYLALLLIFYGIVYLLLPLRLFHMSLEVIAIRKQLDCARQEYETLKPMLADSANNLAAARAALELLATRVRPPEKRVPPVVAPGK